MFVNFINKKCLWKWCRYVKCEILWILCKILIRKQWFEIKWKKKSIVHCVAMGCRGFLCQPFLRLIGGFLKKMAMGWNEYCCSNSIVWNRPPSFYIFVFVFSIFVILSMWRRCNDNIIQHDANVLLWQLTRCFSLVMFMSIFLLTEEPH